MLIVEDAIKFFGQSPQDKPLDDYLIKLGIAERPEFEENPEEWVADDSNGFILIFREKFGYEKLYGSTKANGSMIFSGIRLHSSFNINKFSAYSGVLPFNLSFDQSPDKIKQVLGEPDFEDDPDTPERVFMWNKVRDMQLGMVLAKDEQHVCYMTLKPARKKT